MNATSYINNNVKNSAINNYLTILQVEWYIFIYITCIHADVETFDKTLAIPPTFLFNKTYLDPNDLLTKRKKKNMVKKNNNMVDLITTFATEIIIKYNIQFFFLKI